MGARCGQTDHVVVLQLLGEGLKVDAGTGGKLVSGHGVIACGLAAESKQT